MNMSFITEQDVSFHCVIYIMNWNQISLFCFNMVMMKNHSIDD